MNLGDWRSRIDDLDNQILNLLNQRAEAARSIGDLKRRQDAPSYVPERESEILRRLTAVNRGPLPKTTVHAVWTEILSKCRTLEDPLVVAYLGPHTTFTHQTTLQRFDSDTDYRPIRTIVDVFKKVERGQAHHNVIPVKNTTKNA